MCKPKPQIADRTRRPPRARALRRLTEYIEEVFDAWVYAALEARQALEVWRTCPVDYRGDAHAVYNAALDREERAATVLAAALVPTRRTERRSP